MCFSYEGEQMVLTNRIKRDVFQQDHFVMALSFDIIEYLFRRCFKAGENLFIHPGNPLRGILDPCPLRIFTNTFKDEPDTLFYFLKIHRSKSLFCDQILALMRILVKKLVISVSLELREALLFDNPSQPYLLSHHDFLMEVYQ
jgi:hypothetical protein